MNTTTMGICPQCRLEAERVKKEEKRTAHLQYGSIPIAEFMRLYLKAQEPVNVQPSLHTSAKVVVTAEGRLIVEVRGKCTVCGFVFDFQQQEQVLGCHAGRDGDCSWKGCPQLRDNEPESTGRACPLAAVCEDA